MNRDMMLKVADAIQAEEIATFNMREWIENNHCGTVACVAGFACLLAKPIRRPSFNVEAAAADILDLEEIDSHHLFLGHNVGLESINRQKWLVPDALRWMALTGQVDWQKALKISRCVYEKKLAEQVAYTHLPLDWIP